MLLTSLSTSSPSLQVFFTHLTSNTRNTMQTSKMEALLQLTKTESHRKTKQTKQWTFHTAFFQRVVDAFLSLKEPSCQDMITEYLQGHLDLLYYFVKCYMCDILLTVSAEYNKKLTVNRNHIEGKTDNEKRKRAPTHVTDDVIELLLALPPLTEADEDLYCNFDQLPEKHALNDMRMRRTLFSEAWLKTLRLDLSPMSYKRVLHVMHKRIIPYMTEPTLLIDFLTDSYNQGTSLSFVRRPR